MQIWTAWWALVKLLRSAYSRQRTFLWFAAILAGISMCTDIVGISSLVRSLNISARYYQRLLDNIHSNGFKLDKLTAIWTAIVLKFFSTVIRIKGRPALIGDGIKIGKEGRRMPGVKILYQSSDSNHKLPWIMGHSCQSLAVLVRFIG